MKQGILSTWKVTLHEDSLGITQAALYHMRNELATRIQHKLTVCEVPALEDNCECYGFFITDYSTNEAVIIGDGFRGDGGGEGGAGHRAVQALLLIMGIRPVRLGPEESTSFTGQLLDYEEALETARLFEPRIPAISNQPYYIDSVVR